MIFRKKILASSVLLFVGFGLITLMGSNPSSAAQLNVPSYNYSYLSNSTTGTLLSGVPGILHTVTIDTPVASSVITFYDSANANITAPTIATATILIYPDATSSVTGIYLLTVNGVLVTSTSTASGSTTSTVATNIATAINAAGGANVTATSTGGTIVLTAAVTGTIGNISIPSITSQNGFNFQPTFTNSMGTPIITQITLPTTLLEQGGKTSVFDVSYRNGLVVKQTTATSTLTASWQQN